MADNVIGVVEVLVMIHVLVIVLQGVLVIAREDVQVVPALGHAATIAIERVRAIVTHLVQMWVLKAYNSCYGRS